LNARIVELVVAAVPTNSKTAHEPPDTNEQPTPVAPLTWLLSGCGCFSGGQHERTEPELGAAT